MSLRPFNDLLSSGISTQCGAGFTVEDWRIGGGRGREVLAKGSLEVEVPADGLLEGGMGAL